MIVGLRSIISLLWVMILSLGAVTRTAFAQKSRDDGKLTFHVVRGVPYGQGVSSPLLSDLYLPDGRGPSAAVVFIHGGGWTSGDRGQLAKVAEALATLGYVGFAIDYDLSDKNNVHFPTALHESKEAIRWLRANAAQYHVDPTRIAVAGSSAGGELAALVALTNDDPRYEGDGPNKSYSSSVKAAVIYNAVLDLNAMPDDADWVAKYAGGRCSQMRKVCKDASPQDHIHSGLPAIFVGHGTADQTVPYAQYLAFVAALRKVQSNFQEFTADGGPHTYWLKDTWFRQNLQATIDFLAANLQPSTQAP